MIEVDDVEPGTPAPFRTTTTIDIDDEASDASCDVVEITGPLPFGLDL